MVKLRAQSGNVEHGDSAARAASISISVHDLCPPALRACIESGDGLDSSNDSTLLLIRLISLKNRFSFLRRDLISVI
jgi:hypothetical protein